MIGHEMRAYRARHNMTQEEFAERAGISIMTVSALERCMQEPRAMTLGKIRRVLDEAKSEE